MRCMSKRRLVYCDSPTVSLVSYTRKAGGRVVQLVLKKWGSNSHSVTVGTSASELDGREEGS